MLNALFRFLNSFFFC